MEAYTPGKSICIFIIYQTTFISTFTFTNCFCNCIREWISPAVVTFMANELIQRAAQDPNYKLVNAFDWYISPNLNPDGYEFTHESVRNIT